MDQSPYHYAVMARAIEAIDAHGGETLPLEQLSREIGLSPAHFQRVFSAWAGVSPKRFQQYLTLGHAKALLRERHTTLQTAGEVGLSGVSRLHDLFLRWEAMSPGAYAQGGAGLDIAWGRFDSPFGPALVMGTERGICGIAFTADAGEAAGFADLAGRWPLARLTEDAARLRPWAMAAFGREARAEPVPVLVIGAPFQIKVWEALMRVPSGSVTTYSELAAAIGHPRAVRAVGTAVGRNPVSLLIPCHRALRKSGGLGGYHWGLPVKRAILAWESARADAGADAGADAA